MNVRLMSGRKSYEELFRFTDTFFFLTHEQMKQILIDVKLKHRNMYINYKYTTM